MTSMSTAECPICTDIQHDPKLLPCSHSFCRRCLQQWSDNRQYFPCPTCRRRTKVDELTDNRYLQEYIKYKIQQERKICSDHGTALSLYCSEEECQKCICAACALVQHKGHNLVELKDQAEEAKKIIRQEMVKATKHIDGWDGHIEDFDEAKVSIQEEEERALMKVQEMNEEFTAIIDRLNNVMIETTRIKINEIKTTKDNSMKELEENRRQIQDKKSGVEKQIEEMERQLKMDNPIEVIQWSKRTKNELQTILEDSSHINDQDIVMKVPAFIKPNLQDQLKCEDYGNAFDKEVKIGRPQKTRKSTMWAPLGFKSWGHSKLAVNEDGLIVVYGMKHNGMAALKLFNMEQREIWEQEQQHGDKTDIWGIAFVQLEGQNYIMVSKRKRDVAYLSAKLASTGATICQTKVPHSQGRVCFDSSGQGYIENPDQIKKLCIDIDAFFGRPSAINVDDSDITNHFVNNLFGFGIGKYNGDGKIFILSSWEDRLIQAICVETGEVMWEITGEYEGREINPHGMCTDKVGNIYVADGLNERVLQVSSAGKIERSLFKTRGTAFNVHWLETKLLVFHRMGDQEAITIYCLRAVVQNVNYFDPIVHLYVVMAKRYLII